MSNIQYIRFILHLKNRIKRISSSHTHLEFRAWKRREKRIPGCKEIKQPSEDEKPSLYWRVRFYICKPLQRVGWEACEHAGEVGMSAALWSIWPSFSVPPRPRSLMGHLHKKREISRHIKRGKFRWNCSYGSRGGRLSVFFLMCYLTT